MRKFIVLIILGMLLTACIPQTVPPAPLTPTPSGPCEISTTSSVIAYMLPSAGSEEFGAIGPGETYTATAKTADGFYGFEPGVMQGGNTGIYRLRWVLKTHDLTTTPGCASIPTVAGPIDGLCYAMFMGDTPVYTSADTGSAVVTTLTVEDFVMVTGHPSGWFSVDLNVGSESMDNIGFIEEGVIGGLKGACSVF